jgi:hypothetical protein
MQTDQTHPQSLGWLVLGLALGLLFVLISVLTPSWDTTRDAEVVVIVNGAPITREKFLSYLQSFSEDRNNPLGSGDSEYILQRIIEEELLVQRGVEVGMLESDKRSRAALVNAMISMTTTAAEAKAPGEEELLEFFEDNLGYFTATSRLWVRQLVVKNDDNGQRTRLAHQRLVDGEDFYVVSREFGSPVALSVPDSLLPPAKLREYLGPTLTMMLSQQSTGFISDPQLIDSGYRIVQLVENEISQLPEMETVREQLEAEFVRRAGDKALREYLDWLKQRADISYPSELPL